MAQMSDEEKTEDPTPKRREEAREKGQVARSQDMNSAFIILSGMLILYAFGYLMLERLYGNAMVFFDYMGSEPIMENIEAVGVDFIYLSMITVLPMFGGLFLIAILINLLQTGFIFTWHPLIPKPDKINPSKGFERLFSRRTLVHTAMNLGKLAVIATVVYMTLRERIEECQSLALLLPGQIFTFAADMVFVLGVRVGLALLFLAILDFGYQRWQHEQELRMSRQEIREEMKRMEGDPQTRQRRRSIQRQIAMQRMMSSVPEAEVVITNPTEIAVALKYDTEGMHAPIIVAKGRRKVAERIREIATENDIPIYEDKPLARRLVKIDVGQSIPPAEYRAVAEILAFVYRLKNKDKEFLAAS